MRAQAQASPAIPSSPTGIYLPSHSFVSSGVSWENTWEEFCGKNDVDATDWQKVKRLFHQALDLRSDERAAVLTSACNGDQTLRGYYDKAFDVLREIDASFEIPASILQNNWNELQQRISECDAQPGR